MDKHVTPAAWAMQDSRQTARHPALDDIRTHTRWAVVAPDWSAIWSGYLHNCRADALDEYETCAEPDYRIVQIDLDAATMAPEAICDVTNEVLALRNEEAA